jgi:sortase A
MDAVRRLATRIIALTDDEWETLCSYARGARSDEAAIALVIQQAYRQRDVVDRVSEPAPLGGMAEKAHDGDQPSLAEGCESDLLGDPAGFDGKIVSPVPPGFGLPAAEEPLPMVLERDPPWLDIVAASIPSVSSGIPETRLRSAKGSRVHRRRRIRSGVRPLSERNRLRWLSIASWVRSIGVIILLFVAWQLWGTAITQHHSQSQLQRQFQAKVNHAVTKPGPTFRLIPSTTKLTDPPQGTVMAQIQIPEINVSQYVVSGTDEDDLAKGPGHYLGTAMPGQAGNVVIAGHRTTHGAPFNRLGELARGDPIYLTTLGGQRLTYVVSATPVPVSPTDVTVLNNFGDNRLTLTTCNPEFSAAQRLIVVAAYLPPGANRPAPIARGNGTPYKLAPTIANGWDMSLIPVVLLFGGLLVVLGLANRRFSAVYGREGRWLILIPVWIALLLALFQTLTNFLPASV